MEHNYTDIDILDMLEDANSVVSIAKTLVNQNQNNIHNSLKDSNIHNIVNNITSQHDNIDGINSNSVDKINPFMFIKNNSGKAENIEDGDGDDGGMMEISTEDDTEETKQKRKTKKNLLNNMSNNTSRKYVKGKRQILQNPFPNNHIHQQHHIHQYQQQTRMHIKPNGFLHPIQQTSIQPNGFLHPIQQTSIQPIQPTLIQPIQPTLIQPTQQTIQKSIQFSHQQQRNQHQNQHRNQHQNQQRNQQQNPQYNIRETPKGLKKI